MNLVFSLSWYFPIFSVAWQVTGSVWRPYTGNVVINHYINQWQHLVWISQNTFKRLSLIYQDCYGSVQKRLMNVDWMLRYWEHHGMVHPLLLIFYFWSCLPKLFGKLLVNWFRINWCVCYTYRVYIVCLEWSQKWRVFVRSLRLTRAVSSYLIIIPML